MTEPPYISSVGTGIGGGVRVGVAACLQETNSFSPLPTTLEAFARGQLVDGTAIVERFDATNTEVAGFLRGVREAGGTPVPLFAAWAMSGGPLDAPTVRALRERLGRAVEGAGPLDAVLVALHGATAADDEPDVSGALLADLRRWVGQIPVIATLDLHANVTERMARAADALIGYQTCPHVDHAETGQRAVRVLLRMAQRRRPAVAARKVRMLLPAEHLNTNQGPFARLMERARGAEAGGVWSVSLFPMQPWLDVPEAGFAVVVVGDDARRIHAVADELADAAWASRHEYDVELVPPDAAIRRALAAAARPVLLVDSADAMSSGAPGDSTVLLRAFLDAAPRAPVLMTVRDPDAPRLARAAGAGRTIALTLGARFLPALYQPVPVRATVIAASDGRFRLSAATLRGLEVSMGSAAALRVGGLRIVVHEDATITSDPALYRSLGLEPTEAQAIVVKHPVGWRVGIGEFAAEAIIVDAPGASSPRLARLPFSRVPRPIYPLDADEVMATAGVRRPDT